MVTRPLQWGGPSSSLSIALHPPLAMGAWRDGTMPSFPSILAFVLAAAILVVIPGPAVIYIVNRGISQGRRSAVVSALGIETGALVHVLAATAGLSALIASSRE